MGLGLGGCPNSSRLSLHLGTPFVMVYSGWVNGMLELWFQCQAHAKVWGYVCVMCNLITLHSQSEIPMEWLEV